MKNSMKKYIQRISVMAVFALVFIVAPAHAQAAFNTLGNDCPTVSVANYTTQQNISSTCWGPTASANPGDTINVRIYYHNTASSPADNTIVHLNNPVGPTMSTFNFTGFINSNDGGSANGSGTINLSSPETLTLSHVYWYPDKTISQTSLPNGQSDGSLFTSGVNLGTIQGVNTCASGQSFCHSGSVVASFIVSGSGGTTTNTSCSVSSFTINGSSTFVTVPYGQTATLAWNTSNCGTVTVNGTTYSGAQANSGSVQTPAITASANFILTAGNFERTVTATPSGTGSTCAVSSFTINGSSTVATVAYGTTATLAWNTSNCTTVTVNGIAYTGSQANSGSVQTPAITYSQNFTLTAGSVTRTVTATPSVQQSACQINSFTANGASGSATIGYNTSATIAWNTSNCTTVIFNGITYTGSQAISDSIVTGLLTSPTNTYPLVATDASGNTSTSNLTINVTQNTSACVVNSFTANGASGTTTINSGTSITLAWNTSNCTTVTVNGIAYTGSQANSGSVTIGAPYVGTYPYSLFAVDNFGHTSNANVTVTVSNLNNNYNYCQISYFQPTQSSLVSGAATTLTWTLSGGCTGAVNLSGPNFTNSQIYGNSISTGPIYSYATYILTAYGSNGTPTTATTYVNVNNNNYSNQSCYISSFTANGLNSAQVTSGSVATIAWNTYGCSSVTVSGPGVYSQNASGTMQTSAVYGSATYTINAYSLIYGLPQTQTVYVTTTQPYIVTPTSVNPITTIATNVSPTSARLNGIIPANPGAASVNAYFEYGTTQALGSQTNPQPISAYTLLNYFDTIFTSPNTTYYYRADMNSNGVITTGNIVSFTTPSTVVQYSGDNNNYTSTNYVVSTVTHGTGTGSAFAEITIADQYQNVAPGDLIDYTINYKNISSSTLSNAMINVVLPNGITYKGSSQGMPTTNNTVVVTLGSLTPGATGFVNVQATVDSDVVVGNNLLATATLTFSLPSGAQDTAIAYYMNTVALTNSNNLAGFAFGAGFFPTTLLGWILLLGLIIIIILIARHYSILSRNAQNNKAVTTEVHDIHTESTH